ncbi:sensor domain-containing diguanylate cyclase [Deltaproteobacteria bacterium Smac51]|nr:sensor domain-containing diguanylate cyclase [Deltaproteobacteria bacterium Smac51]
MYVPSPFIGLSKYLASQYSHIKLNHLQMLVFSMENKMLNESRKISPKAAVVLLLSLFLCSLLIGVTIKNKYDLEKVTMERVIIEKSISINEVVSKLLYKTQALAALVIQNNGEIANFEKVAATIVDDPAILNILVAPEGVVSGVYPLKGNERVLGYSLLGEGKGNTEARLAVEKGQLVFGGPFELIQGGRALVGRLPVWLEESDNDRRFWGLVSVTLKYPEVLNGAGLETLVKQGLSYEIWRTNPDDNERQIIAHGGEPIKRGDRYIEEDIPILNATWHFRVATTNRWYSNSENWILIFIGLAINVLIIVIIQNNIALKAMKNGLERMIRTDALTGLLNRQGLFHELDKLVLKEKSFKLYYLDLNYFKPINDTYGHDVGDYVLKEFTVRMWRSLNGKSIFARVGGDEFVMVRHGNELLPEREDKFWRNVAEEFAKPIIAVGGKDIFLSFSTGEASYPDDGSTIDNLIIHADQKMYEQKNNRYAREKMRRASDWTDSPE